MTGHSRIDTRTVKAAHVEKLGLPHARQAIKVTRWRQNATTKKISRESIYLVTSLTSAEATPADLARLLREHWSIEVHHHIRDLSFDEDHRTNRTGHGPINLATIREAIINTIQDIGYLYVPKADVTTSARATLSTFTTSHSRATHEYAGALIGTLPAEVRLSVAEIRQHGRSRHASVGRPAVGAVGDCVAIDNFSCQGLVWGPWTTFEYSVRPPPSK